MFYLNVEDARKTLGHLGNQETAITKHGKIAFYIVPPESMAKLRLAERQERLAKSRQRVDDYLADKVQGGSFEEL